MTDTQITAAQQTETAVQARLKDLEEENELLLLQLHQVQEELESYFLKCRELERGGGGNGAGSFPAGGWVDDDLPTMQAEVSRLTTLVETQTRLHDIASRNALNARLGDILIQSVSPGGSLIGLPARLLAIWRASTSDQPPARLGGKNFDKVIETFQAGGPESVSQLLAAEPAPEMRAKAWTALARHQMKSGLFADAAHSARRAYEEEPKPYRLKWLAFRLHDAGEIAEADACLSLLPQDTPFSDSEARQRDQVRYEAKNARLREAKHKTGFESRRQAMESQMQTLRRDCDRHAGLAAEREGEIKSLQQAQARLEQDKSVLAAEREGEIKSLQQAQARLEQDKSVLAAQQEVSGKLLAERNAEIEALGKAFSELEQEKSALAAQQEASVKLLAERYAEIESLRIACSRVEQEKLAISRQRIESSLLLSEREAEIRILNQTRAHLEQQLSALVAQNDELANLAETRLGDIETLRQGLNDIEQEKAGLTAQLEASARLSAEREAKIDCLSQASGKFDQERAELKKSIEELTRQRDEQSRLAQDRIRQIEEMQRKAQEREAAETELATRQELIHEEMVRAEAQLDLLKEILLREQGV